MKHQNKGKGLVLAGLSAILLLGACSNNEKNEGSASSGATASSSASSSQAAGEQNPYAEKMTIQMFNAGTWSTDPLPPREEDAQRKKLEESVNIDLQMTIPQAGEADAKLNTLLSSGDIPDLIFFNDRAKAVQFYEDGLLADIGDYLDAYPDLKARFTDDQWAALQYKGKTIGTPGLELVSGINGWWIRNDWLKNLGLSMPTNTEELLQVMKAFTYDDPDQNGKDDTYGYLAGVPKDGNIASSTVQLGLNNLMWLFGVNPHKIEIANGAIVDHNTDPRMKEALTYINRLVTEKVIDPDWVTISDAVARDEKIQKGKIGIVVSDWRLMDNPEKIIEVSGEEPDWVSIPPVKGPEGQQILGELAFQSNLWAVSAKAAKDPEKVKRILALLQVWYADKEAYPLFAYGTQGVFWDYNDKHEVVRKTVDADTTKKYGWNTHYKLTRGAADPVYYNFKKPEITAAAQQTNIDYSIPALPSAYLVPDESDTLSQDRMKYVNETLLRFIYGREPISNWDKYIQTLETTYKLKDYEANATKQLQELGLLK